MSTIFFFDSKVKFIIPKVNFIDKKRIILDWVVN